MGVVNTLDLEQIGALDPTDWQPVQQMGHLMLDEMLEFMQTHSERPAWVKPPAAAVAAFDAPVPMQGADLEDLYEQFKEHILPYALGNAHPRFWSWVNGCGTASGMLVEMLTAAMNTNAFGAEQIAIYVEQQVLAWFKELLGFPFSASGILVSGGSMANLVGLTVARNAMAGFDVKELGMAAAPQELVCYATAQTHYSVRKALELLGMGSKSLRLIPVDANFQMDIAELQNAIHEDRGAGRKPICVVGTAGTVNTGAVDPLDRIADVCTEEELWFHCDGAFGAMPALSPRLKSMTTGMERADSLAFDLHKWLHVTYDVGCTLIRDPLAHHMTFATSGSYLTHMPGGVAAGPFWFSEHGLQLSRQFRALKVWFLMKEYGVEKLAASIEMNVEQAQYLEARVRRESELELLAEVPMNVVCFRYLFDKDADNLNRELLVRLHDSGIAGPSFAFLNGKFGFRVAITNHRSRKSDFDMLVDGVLKFGREIAAENS
jgi:aromatic-L-amino-acid decarboxylase